MSDENFLSQDDIDALMGGLSGDPGTDNESKGGPPSNPEDIQSALEMILRQASTVISTVLNKNTELGINQVIKATETSVWGKEELLKTSALCLRVSFISGLSGDLFMVFSKKETALLADLMMMGDGSAEYEEDHKDALGELGNQIMGAVCTAMGTDFGLSISCDQVDISDYGESEGVPFTPSDSTQASVNIKVEDFEDTEILMIVDSVLASSFQSNTSGEEDTHSTEESPSPSSSMELDVSDEALTDLDNGPDTSPASSSFATTGNPNVDLLLDIPLDVTIELGRADLSIRKILELGPGSIVELNRKASEPVDLLVNDKVVAKGEVVVVDEYFGIRIVSLVTPEERIKLLR